jgi:hypothetical protein
LRCSLHTPSRQYLPIDLTLIFTAVDSSSGLQFIDLLLLQLQFLVLLLDNIHHERAAEKNGRFIDIVMLVADVLLAKDVAAFKKKRSNSPERSYTARLKQERRSLLQGMADPSLGKGAQNMPMSDDQDVAGLIGSFFLGFGEGRRLPLLADFLDQPVDTLRHLLW